MSGLRRTVVGFVWLLFLRRGEAFVSPSAGSRRCEAVSLSALPEDAQRRDLLQSFEMGNGASAQEILEAMQNALVEPRPTDIGLAAAAYCRNNKNEQGWWKKALDLLLSKPSPEVPIDAYDAVLACLVEERNWKEAIRLLRELERGTDRKRKKILYPEPSLTTYREVVECCVAANQLDHGLRIVTSMCERGIKPTVYTFELVVSVLAKKLQWRRCLQLIDLMEECERPKTVLTYNTIISACARAKEVGMAKNLLSRMRKEGIKPSVVTYNSVISACASTSRWKDAMTVLDQCNRDPHCTPDLITYTNAIRACAKGRKTDRALTLYEVVKHKKLPLDSYFYAAVIEACAKAKKWEKALDLLYEMEEEGVAPTDVIYSVTITACGNAGQWKRALDLLDVMGEKEMRINRYVYNSAITALAKAAKQSAKRRNSPKQGSEQLSIRAMELLDQMRATKIMPDGFSYSSAISCCGAELRWQEAVKLLNESKEGGPQTRPNKIAYTAAIAACGRAGESETSMRLFREMRESGHAADAVAFNAVFSSLRVARKADVALDLWGEMCETKGATPDVISLTEVIATLQDRGKVVEVDKVFAEAVKQGIVLAETKVSLDSLWEVDLSSMSFPVARAACRYVVARARQAVQDGEQPEDLCFITGVSTQKAKSSLPSRSLKKRGYLQGVLRDDFTIESIIPKYAQGTVQIDKSILEKWIQSN